jgi:tetratricopeptide (TPR) repeat protein
MRKFSCLAFFALALAAAQNVAAQPQTAPQSDAAKADSFYRDGKFDEAAPIYAQLAKADPDNPWFHYNLGNSYYKTNKLGLAIASYMRAYRLLPRNGDIRYNLALALKRSGQTLVPQGMPETVHRLYYLFSDVELQGLFWLALWLACLAGAAFALIKQAKPVSLRVAAISAAFTLLFGGWWFLRAENDYSSPAVAIDSVTEIRSGPGPTFNTSATMPEGHIVEIIDSKEDWYEISIRAEGIKGWVLKTSVAPISEPS